MSLTKTKNPFYLLLVVAGIAFALTACAYGVMMVQNLEPPAGGEPAERHGLIVFMEEHGFTALMAELGVLAVATFLAIGTDEFWNRRAGSPAAPW